MFIALQIICALVFALAVGGIVYSLYLIIKNL